MSKFFNRLNTTPHLNFAAEKKDNLPEPMSFPFKGEPITVLRISRSFLYFISELKFNCKAQRYTLAVILSSFLFLQASALTTPDYSPIHHIQKDTTADPRASFFYPPAHVQKVGFFGKLKNKLSGFILKKQVSNQDKAGAKRILGFVSVGLIILGIGIALLAQAPALLWLVPAGFIAGIVALCLKGNATDKEENKKSNKIALVGISIVVAVLGFLAIAFSGRRH